MTVADYTETAFARSPRLHHKDALEGPSSAGFGRRNLVGMMGVMMAMAKGENMKTIKCDVQCSTTADCYNWISSLDLSRPFLCIRKDGDSVKNTHLFGFYCYTYNGNPSIMAWRRSNLTIANWGVTSGATSAAVIDKDTEFVLSEVAWG